MASPSKDLILLADLLLDDELADRGQGLLRIRQTRLRPYSLQSRHWTHRESLSERLFFHLLPDLLLLLLPDSPGACMEDEAHQHARMLATACDAHSRMPASAIFAMPVGSR